MGILLYGDGNGGEDVIDDLLRGDAVEFCAVVQEETVIEDGEGDGANVIEADRGASVEERHGARGLGKGDGRTRGRAVGHVFASVGRGHEASDPLGDGVGQDDAGDGVEGALEGFATECEVGLRQGAVGA